MISWNLFQNREKPTVEEQEPHLQRPSVRRFILKIFDAWIISQQFYASALNCLLGIVAGFRSRVFQRFRRSTLVASSIR